MRGTFCMVITALCVLGTAPAEAQTASRFGSSLTIIVEEDTFLRLGTLNDDRNYTGALGISYTADGLYRFPLNWLLGFADGIAADGNMKPLVTNSVIFGTSAFTPDNIITTDPVVGDRPYSSIVAVGSRRTIVPPDSPEWALSSELFIARLGQRLGANVQNGIHKALDMDTASGWHNQISDGGEWTALLRARYQRVLWGVDAHMSDDPTTEVTLSPEGSAGYYTNVSVGLAFRAGRIRSPFHQFNSGSMSFQSQAARPARSGNEWFLFGSVRPRLVLYNALLQGQLRDSRYEMDGSDLRRTPVEFDVGVSGTRACGRRAATLTAVFMGRTSELDTSFARTHYWGSLQFTWHWAARN
jgi:hypothetical protein